MPCFRVSDSGGGGGESHVKAADYPGKTGVFVFFNSNFRNLGNVLPGFFFGEIKVPFLVRKNTT